MTQPTFARSMSKFAVIVPISRRTSDRRTIRWLECELHDADTVTRDPLRAFFTMESARAWAASQGYEVRA